MAADAIRVGGVPIIGARPAEGQYRIYTVQIQAVTKCRCGIGPLLVTSIAPTFCPGCGKGLVITACMYELQETGRISQLVTISEMLDQPVVGGDLPGGPAPVGR